MEILDSLMACDDCLMYVVNDELPADYPGLREDIWAHLDLTPDRYLALGHIDAEEEFSWRPCECCGSTLGGRRNEIILIGE
jgi:hypothetical protein